MNIIPTTFLKYRGEFKKRNETKWHILHHAKAKSCTVDDIHKWHLDRGPNWLGFGYHFFVRKSGLVYAGRPIDVWGAHTSGHNHYSIGTCFEGDFDQEQMEPTQLFAGRELVKAVAKWYPEINTLDHGKAYGQNTNCPGTNFPYWEIVKPEDRTEIIKQIKGLLDKLK